MSDTPTEVAPDATTDIPADTTPEPEVAPEPASEVAPEPVANARRPRRLLRAALRWTAALLVLAAFGGATAYAVTQPERTKLPGLRTPDDGRWTYPPLALPKLPVGRPAPLDEAKNIGGVHYNDMRSLLLPLPEGARNDPALPGVKGWVPTAAYLKKFSLSDIPAAQVGMEQEGVRHIAGRAWTMPDGTRTEIYLVQFLSNAYASAYSSTEQTESLAGVKASDRDTSVQSSSVPTRASLYAYDETPPYGATATRYAYILAGDTVALVMQSGKQPGAGGTPAVPFRQTVRLQAQMLG
ncbi:hypothetical protein AB0M29_23830 [Streptomyces sp. NPDC051976]|uniref:hypothetical protein n=1 Tax=Streptomyces sp. NPDC051976 TaxID=3154947 RepID=UPI003421CCE4